jgi:L-cysteine S-thiosulfotransferase
MAGSGRSPRKRSAEWFGRGALAGFAALLLTSGGGRPGGGEAGLVPYAVVGDAIPASLTGTAGDPASGRAIVGNRQLGLCLLCHSGPFCEDRLQGTLAPSLAGVGSRLSAGQLRLRVIDMSRVNPKTIMPPYYRTQDLTRVAPSYASKPILGAGQVEDVVAFLATLTE